MPHGSVRVHAMRPDNMAGTDRWMTDDWDPFLDPRFLRAAVHQGPGTGRPLVLEADVGGKVPARWGVVERTRLGFKAAVAWQAPMIPTGADHARAWAALLDALAARGHALLRFESHATVRLSAADLAAAAEAARARGWVTETHPFGTVVLDLTVPVDERWKGVHKSHQRAIRTAGKENLRLARLEPDRFEDYVAISDATYTRQGMVPTERAFLEHLFDFPSRFRFYMAYDTADRPQAGVVIGCTGDAGVYLHGGSGDRRVRGIGNWLHWEVSKALEAEGFRRYDLGGVDLTTPGGKAEGIRTFKTRFGGTLEEHPAMDVVFRPFMTRTLLGGLALVRKWTPGRG